MIFAHPVPTAVVTDFERVSSPGLAPAEDLGGGLREPGVEFGAEGLFLRSVPEIHYKLPEFSVAGSITIAPRER